ncbi:MAG: nucleotide disphospho-sugar-binding domain-containing protein [Candidatus Anammoxibacter sp.]
MAKFLFTVMPGSGHINPTLPIATELKKRGHDVGYATGADFQNIITSEGLRFFSVGPAGLKSAIKETSKIGNITNNYLKNTGLLADYYFLKLILEMNVMSIDSMRSVVKQFRPDVIVCDFFTHAGAQIAEVFNLPWATTCTVPGLIPGGADVPPHTPWGLPSSNNAFFKGMYHVARFFQERFFRLFDRSFNNIRSTLGLAPIKGGVIYNSISPYLILSPTCEGFEYKRSDWPPQMYLTGPAPWGKEIDEVNSFDWINSMPSNKPIIYVTLGTVQSLIHLDFYKIVIDAFKSEPYQVIMSIGQALSMSEFDYIPENFRLEQYIPHSKILPKVTAVIHHGGQGIVQDSIFHGLPSLVIPIANDQYEMARRCLTAGVSVRIPYPKINPERLRTAIRKVLNDTAIQKNTKKLQAIFRNTNSGVTGATLIEKLAETKAPVYRAEN